MKVSVLYFIFICTLLNSFATRLASHDDWLMLQTPTENVVIM